MDREFLLVSGSLYFTALLAGWIAFLAWRRSERPGALPFSLLMCAAALWNLSQGLEMTAAEETWKLIFWTLGFASGISVPVLFLVFSISHARETPGLTRRSLIMLSLAPAAAVLLAATNKAHHWIWSSYWRRPGAFYFLLFQFETGYYLLLLYSYVLALAGLIILARAWIRRAAFGRGQTGVLLLAALLPLVLSLLHVAGCDWIPGLDLTSPILSLAGTLAAFLFFRAEIFNIIPVAREILIEKMNDGVLVLDAQNRVADINAAAQRFLGVSAAELLGRRADSLPAEWQAAVEEKGEASAERREIRLDGNRPLYLELQIIPLLDRRRRLQGRMLVFHDVTERREVEAQLALRAAELDLLNRISLAITSGLELDGVLKTLHEQCRAIIPSDVFYVALYDDATGIVQLSLYYEGDYQSHPPFALRGRAGLTGYIIETRRTLYLPDVTDPAASLPATPIRVGGTMSRSYIGIPLVLRDKVIGVMSVQSYQPAFYTENQVRLLEMVAVEAAIAIENARLYGEVQRLAIIDELTGIYNYRGLMEFGRREVERARRFNHPLSLFFFDIDDFRNFNNTYSHATGNEVLKAIAQRAGSILRAVDIFARYGGDEFVVLLPETDREMAWQAAQRLRREISDTRVATSHGEMSVTISLGVATLTEDIQDITAFIDRANRAERRAKRKGNCVQIEK